MKNSFGESKQTLVDFGLLESRIMTVLFAKHVPTVIYEKEGLDLFFVVSS